MRTSRLAVPATLACAAVLLPASAAAAAEPERTGWWNRLSAAGTALPQPQTRAGDLRVTSGPDGPVAYSAVLYTAPGSTAATLDLVLREGSAVGTPEVAVCPTLETEWPEGENQPYDKAPEYDCGIGVSVGVLSEDGTTLSFELDSTTQVEEGVWSLALVPSPDGSGEPFTVDVEKPGPESFTAEAATSFEDPATTFESDPGTSSADGGSGGSGDAFLSGGFEAPESTVDSGVVEPPLLAGGADAALPGAGTPAPAPQLAAPGAATGPILYARPAGVVEDLGTGRRLLGLLVLAGGSAAVGYAAGQQRPGPRLLGGRARLAPPAAVPAGGVPAPQERPRGIGRFAKVRETAPRRLR